MYGNPLQSLLNWRCYCLQKYRGFELIHLESEIVARTEFRQIILYYREILVSISIEFNYSHCKKIRMRAFARHSLVDWMRLKIPMLIIYRRTTLLIFHKTNQV